MRISLLTDSGKNIKIFNVFMIEPATVSTIFTRWSLLYPPALYPTSGWGHEN